MKNLECKFLVPLLYLAYQVAIVGAAESTLCPGHDAFEVSENVLAACEWNKPESVDQCTSLIDDLSNLEYPTAQQQYDLVYAMRDLADYADRKGMLELIDRAGVVFRSLHEKHPNDISLLFWDYIYSEEKEGLGILRRMLQVAPDCSKVRQYLLDELEFDTDYLDDADISEDVRAEISHHISVGYDLAATDIWKMRFGTMMFESLMLAGRSKLAKQMQKRIFAELDVANLRYDDASRAENLRTICDFSAIRLRFTKHCLDAIEQSLAHDIELGRTLGDDVLQAIQTLGFSLTFVDPKHTFDGFTHPTDANEYDFEELPFFPQEAVRYVIRLGDMIRGIPVELQTLALHRANMILSRNEEKQMLEEMLKRAPDNEELRNALKHY